MSNLMRCYFSSRYHNCMDNLLNEIFYFDVDTYSTLVDNKVRIECADQRNYTGRVYTVDPLTQRYGIKPSFLVFIFAFDNLKMYTE